MGGAVSSGRDNNELIDNLMGGNYIRTQSVERVFRALDRADYMTPEARDQAYKDLAWRNGPLHMSAPCIYSEVMEGLELKPGLSFLNIGSGTGYLSTLVGLILGSSGISHGVEVHSFVVEYATRKMGQFLENSPTLDEFDYCEPKFYCGNGLCLAPLQAPYDRVYCGAGCPEEYQNYFKQLIKVGGILVMPLNDNLLQVRRVSAGEWSTRSLLNVSFATLRVPTKEDAADLLRLEEQSPARLQALARASIRAAMRAALRRRHPALREPPPRAPPAKKACPRRICIPIDTDSDAEGLNALHDLDRGNGANEMNALLSLVLSMGHNRVAGALRVDPLDSPSPSSDDSDDEEDDQRPEPADRDRSPARRPSQSPEHDRSDTERDNLIMFEFRDHAESDPPARARARSPAAAPTAGDAPTTGNAHAPPPRPPPPGTPRSDAHDDMPSLPAEVEIYLGKTADAPSTSTMEWEKESKREHSSDEDTTESVSKAKEEKRQKFDSGLGEENSPSSGSSPPSGSSPASMGDSDAGDSRRSESLSDDVCADGLKGRRRRQKRGHGPSTRSSSSTDGEGGGEDDGVGEGAGEGGGGAVPARRRHRRRAGEGGDARRVRLSVLMKRGVKELPLPYALKKYVNLGRCFEF